MKRTGAFLLALLMLLTSLTACSDNTSGGEENETVPGAVTPDTTAEETEDAEDSR